MGVSFPHKINKIRYKTKRNSRIKTVPGQSQGHDYLQNNDTRDSDYAVTSQKTAEICDYAKC